jgi:NAD+ synthetase
MIDYKKFVENSRKWLSRYIKDNHLQSLVIGVSGGIDSTVSCAIAYPICKELNIPLIGRSLPTGTNKQIECDVADLVGKAFCTDYKVVALDRTYFSIVRKFEENEGFINNIQSGNIKARLRMMYLRHLASVHKGVVLDNDNFTEWNLGFWTVGGDSPMDINLGLHYLWKTEVYELAHYLYNETLENGIPTKQSASIMESMALVPTDGNGVSSSDCEQFGLENYKQVDDVLRTMYFPDGGMDNITYKNEYIRLIDSYNEQGVDKVMVLHQNTGYKRIPAPIKPTKEELGLC